MRLLIDAKNDAYQKLLQANTRSCKRLFQPQQGIAQKAVTKAKEKWIQKRAVKREEVKKDRRTRWSSIHRLQQIHAGHYGKLETI